MFHSFIVPTLWLCDTQPFYTWKIKIPGPPPRYGEKKVLIHLPPCPNKIPIFGGVNSWKLFEIRRSRSAIPYHPRTPQGQCPTPTEMAGWNRWLRSDFPGWCFCWREVDFSTTLPKKKNQPPKFSNLFGLCDERTGMLLPSPQGAIVANKGLGWDPLPNISNDPGGDYYWDEKGIPNEYIHIHMFQVQGPKTGIMCI